MVKLLNKIAKKRGYISIILSIGIVVPAYYLLRAAFSNRFPDDNITAEVIDSFIFTIIMAVVLYGASSLISISLEKKLPWQGNARRRFFVQFFVVTIVTIVLSSIIAFLYFRYVKLCFDVEPIIFDVVIISLIITIIINAISEGSYLFKQWKAALVNAEKLKQENIQSQFESLKNQVNPHFLFNSLNTLATIIPEDPEQAVQFVQKLSNVYRYVLQYKDNETVDLKTELGCIEAYFFLQKIRFGNNLHVHINVSENDRKRQVPPLTLQILVENAIKHNIISQQKPLQIDIYIDDAGMLVTRNNLQKKKSVESSTKIGLQNLMNRCNYIFGQGIDIFETDRDFIVKVPLG